MQHVGRRNVVCDHDHLGMQLVHIAAIAQHFSGAGQDFQNPFRHLLDIGLALAQVGIFNFVELGRQLVDLGHQGPLGVVVAAADDVERRF